MKARLLDPERDFDATTTVGHEPDLTRDLNLGVLVNTMASGDPLVAQVARAALFSPTPTALLTILYRQQALVDALANGTVIRDLYSSATDALGHKRWRYLGFLSRYPGGILSGSLSVLELFVDVLRKMRSIADRERTRFQSPAFARLFGMFEEELSDAYLNELADHLEALQFNSGVPLTAGLGKGNAAANLILRQQAKATSWLQRLLGSGPPSYVVRIDPRDEAGGRALSDLRNRGINVVANAAAQATEHVAGFFETLRTELAFYVGALNLRDRLAAIGAPTCLPRPKPASSRHLMAHGLYDVGLALEKGETLVGNTVDADGQDLVVVTGANQGGKSTFLRSVGVAQLMMQAGLFVGAESFTAELCTSLFTHFRREEDATMTRGKLDEELDRLSAVVDHISANDVVLLNESFAATNEREGSEIATQVVGAFLERRIKVVFVTHSYAFAIRAKGEAGWRALFLRAERGEDGSRTFRMVRGDPLPTSFGRDVFNAVFGASA